ncbi:MAG TPA: ABC transporter permease [Thermoanaerobaculaceae bacterium]|nr:ABC transporter permease [Thermoanaerobaculaceae bacterium]
MSTRASEYAPQDPAARSDDADGPPTRIIRPVSGWLPLDLAELWRYRELVFFLAWRDVQLRYRQTLLGIAWAILQPLFTAVVFAVFFGYLGHIPSDGSPYPLFALVGLVAWQLFAFALLQSSESLVANQHILRRAYFPRIVVPMASIGAGVLDFLASGAVVAVALGWYGVHPTWRLLFLPMLAVQALCTAMGVGLWLATLNVRYRDVRYTLPFLAQIWLLATPVAYPASIVPERWRSLLGVNPMAGVVEGFRWAILGTGRLSPGLLGVSSIIAVALLVSGLYYMRRMEPRFADVI